MHKSKKSMTIASPATRRFVSGAWKAQKNPPWDFLHSFVYARWPYLYIGIGGGEHPIARVLNRVFQVFRHVLPERKPKKALFPSNTRSTGTVADIYHGKAMPLELAQKLVMVNEPITLPDLEQVVPYVRARAIIQENPDHIIVVKCPCRMSKKDPCLPLDVCLVIGEPFASFTYQHYPTRARWISQEEALEILEREDERGRVHHAFFSEMMLGRFFAICNCCSCCCTAMKAHQRGTPMLASSGYVAQIDSRKCISCNTCQAYCQFGALGMVNKTNYLDEALCMGCGVCVNKCPQGAISLRLDASKGKPLEIVQLIEHSRAVPICE
jgi:Pyruvate/2-oxoacid:ferredoxin oxidoreductase delta subunit